MFNLNKPKDPQLDEAISDVLRTLNSLVADSEEYSKAADQLTKLYAIKHEQKPDRVGKDTLLIVLGNIVGIIAIVNHEQTGIVTSKAIGFVRQFK